MCHCVYVPYESVGVSQAEALKEENDSLRCQLDAYRNEVELLKQEQGKNQPISTEEDNAHSQQLSFLQQALQGMQKVALIIHTHTHTHTHPHTEAHRRTLLFPIICPISLILYLLLFCTRFCWRTGSLRLTLWIFPCKMKNTTVIYSWASTLKEYYVGISNKVQLSGAAFLKSC